LSVLCICNQVYSAVTASSGHFGCIVYVGMG
jgi:hypothetical protein